MADEPVVSNVRFFQRPGTGILDISYDLADLDTANLTVAVTVSTNQGTSWFSPASNNLTGSVGEFVVAPGVSKTVVWQGWRELPNQMFSNVLVKVSADDSPARYLVVDLSGGTNTTSYPVTYMATAPVGGWTDIYKTSNLVMRIISPGTFAMGSPVGELGRSPDETQHTVTLTKNFYIGVFEVTQRQWELVMGNRPSYFTNSSYYATRPVEQVSYYDIRENPGNINDPAVDWPINNEVSSNSFIGKLRAKTGLSTFDLPTESQWEYACRAGTTTALNSGHNLTNAITDARMAAVGRYKTWAGPSDGTSVGTAKVGSYVPNAWGLYDMHGNLWEWCLDWYGTYPGTVSDPVGVASGSGRVDRGGSWAINEASACRSAYRNNRTQSNLSADVGFRLVIILP
jgi:formylglycine-generating enzyme required for sulfatase activity